MSLERRLDLGMLSLGLLTGAVLGLLGIYTALDAERRQQRGQSPAACAAHAGREVFVPCPGCGALLRVEPAKEARKWQTRL